MKKASIHISRICLITLLVVFLTLFAFVMYYVARPIMLMSCGVFADDYIIKDVTEEETLENRESIYQKVINIAEEHGYSTTLGDSITINIDENAEITCAVYNTGQVEYFYLHYEKKHVESKDRGEKIDKKIFLEITNLISAMKITEDDIDSLLYECDKQAVNGRKFSEASERKTLLPYVCEEIFYSTEYRFSDPKYCYRNPIDSNKINESLSILATTTNCLKNSDKYT